MSTPCGGGARDLPPLRIRRCSSSCDRDGRCPDGIVLSLKGGGTFSDPSGL